MAPFFMMIYLINPFFLILFWFIEPEKYPNNAKALSDSILDKDN